MTQSACSSVSLYVSVVLSVSRYVRPSLSIIVPPSTRRGVHNYVYPPLCVCLDTLVRQSVLLYVYLSVSLLRCSCTRFSLSLSLSFSLRMPLRSLSFLRFYCMLVHPSLLFSTYIRLPVSLAVRLPNCDSILGD